ncbi:MAG: hypothetical protein R3A11_02580 [Bdellovibrionota bacterium]
MYSYFFLTFLLLIPSFVHSRDFEAEFKKDFQNQKTIKRLSQYAKELSEHSECIFLTFAYYPNDINRNPEALCIHEIKETRGIFMDVACVAKIICPDRQEEQDFYGSRGHWGIYQPCEEKALKDEFSKEKKNLETPKTAYKEKVKDGKRFFLIHDSIHFWEFFLTQIGA